MLFVIPAEMVQKARTSKPDFAKLFEFVRQHLDQTYPTVYDDILSEVFLYSFKKYDRDEAPYFASYLMRMLKLRLRHVQVRENRRRVRRGSMVAKRHAAIQWTTDLKSETPSTPAQDLLYGPLEDFSECSRALIQLLRAEYTAQKLEAPEQLHTRKVATRRDPKQMQRLTLLRRVLHLFGFTPQDVQAAVQTVRSEVFCG
jgi:hypothetical protein